MHTAYSHLPGRVPSFRQFCSFQRHLSYCTLTFISAHPFFLSFLSLLQKLFSLLYFFPSFFLSFFVFLLIFFCSIFLFFLLDSTSIFCFFSFFLSSLHFFSYFPSFRMSLPISFSSPLFSLSFPPSSSGVPLYLSRFAIPRLLAYSGAPLLRDRPTAVTLHWQARVSSFLNQATETVRTGSTYREQAAETHFIKSLTTQVLA